MGDWLHNFVVESNRIEGILRKPSQAELDAHAVFLALDQITIDDLASFVAVVQPGAKLRDKRGMNVRVGRHVAPPGGDDVPAVLQTLLDEVNHSSWTATGAPVVFYGSG